MAKDVFTVRLEEVRGEIAKKRKEVDKLKDDLNNDLGNPGHRAGLKAKKLEMQRLTDEECELQRAVSRLAGGKQYTVEP